MNHFPYSLQLQFFAEEKTEPATARRRQEAREKGQVARSQEIPSAFGLLAGMLSLLLFGSGFLTLFKQLFPLVLSNYSDQPMNVETLGNLSMQMLGMIIQPLLPFLAVVMGVGILSNALQVGPLLTLEPIKPKWERINPIQGLKRIFSLRAFVDLVKSLIKVAAVGGVAYIILWNERDHLLTLSQYSINSIEHYVYEIIFKMGVMIAIVLVILSFLDYLFQRYEYNKGLRMSKQEIKDEWKKIEGDPLIKSKIRERQRQMAMRRMMQEVPKADVVITNPTHFAVALRYEAGKMKAPVVIAKGQDYLALRIKEIARAHNIPLMENKPLAQTLYRRVEIGESIPEDLFKAVAEVLAYVYQLKRRTGRINSS
ncbi:Flagellar biosynthetic protein flhB [[Clostridium] ultunense Esp]|nr:Flagellar biosynthetic protein flhB [[Clostridium] ultunense Esp]